MNGVEAAVRPRVAVRALAERAGSRDPSWSGPLSSRGDPLCGRGLLLRPRQLSLFHDTFPDPPFPGKRARAWTTSSSWVPGPAVIFAAAIRRTPEPLLRRPRQIPARQKSCAATCSIPARFASWRRTCPLLRSLSRWLLIEVMVLTGSGGCRDRGRSVHGLDPPFVVEQRAAT